MEKNGLLPIFKYFLLYPSPGQSLSSFRCTSEPETLQRSSDGEKRYLGWERIHGCMPGFYPIQSPNAALHLLHNFQSVWIGKGSLLHLVYMEDYRVWKRTPRSSASRWISLDPNHTVTQMLVGKAEVYLRTFFFQYDRGCKGRLSSFEALSLRLVIFQRSSTWHAASNIHFRIYESRYSMHAIFRSFSTYSSGIPRLQSMTWIFQGNSSTT